MKIGIANPLPWVGEYVNIVRMLRHAVRVLVRAGVMLRSREVAQEPVIRNSLEQEEGTFAALFSYELHRAILADLLREEKGNEAVVEAPMPFVVSILNELDGVHDMLLNLL